MIRKVQVTANACECDVCHYKWVSITPEPPVFCPNKKCRSREWNGKILKKHGKEISLPAPRKTGKIRTAIMLDEEF